MMHDDLTIHRRFNKFNAVVGLWMTDTFVNIMGITSDWQFTVSDVSNISNFFIQLVNYCIVLFFNKKTSVTITTKVIQNFFSIIILIRGNINTI